MIKQIYKCSIWNKCWNIHNGKMTFDLAGPFITGPKILCIFKEKRMNGKELNWLLEFGNLQQRSNWWRKTAVKRWRESSKQRKPCDEPFYDMLIFVPSSFPIFPLLLFFFWSKPVATTIYIGHFRFYFDTNVKSRSLPACLYAFLYSTQ